MASTTSLPDLRLKYLISASTAHPAGIGRKARTAAPYDDGTRLQRRPAAVPDPAACAGQQWGGVKLPDRRSGDQTSQWPRAYQQIGSCRPKALGCRSQRPRSPGGLCP